MVGKKCAAATDRPGAASLRAATIHHRDSLAISPNNTNNSLTVVGSSDSEVTSIKLPLNAASPTAIMTDADSLTNCRFYEEKYPEIESFVMVNVKQVRWLYEEPGLVRLARVGADSWCR